MSRGRACRGRRLCLDSICSGLGTDREALADIQAMNPTLQVDYVFALDIDPASKTIIEANHDDLQHFYSDACRP